MSLTFEQKLNKIFFTQENKSKVFRNLRTWLESEMPLDEALARIYSRFSKRGKKTSSTNAVVIGSWIKKMEEGSSFYEASEQWLNDMERALISAGDSSNNLALALTNIEEYYENKGKMVKVMLSAITMPTVLISLMISIIIYIGLEVFPMFEGLLERGRWPAKAQIMYATAEFLRYNLVYIITSIVGILVFLKYFLPNYVGPGRVYLDYFPLFKNYRVLVGSGFLLSLGALVKSGMTFDVAIEKLYGPGSRYLNNRIRTILTKMQEGYSNAEAFSAAGQKFPDDDVIDDIEAYADTQKLDVGLTYSAQNWINESLLKLEKSSAIMNKLFMFMVAALILILVGSFFELAMQLQSSMQMSG